MPKQPHFKPALFLFLRQLKKNNRREWFMANKERYEEHVREPMLNFVSDFAPRLAKISPHFVADPRPVGGSVFRVYRDTRFSKDKSPYKTIAAAQFRHESGRDVHAPGFYLHLEPGNTFIGTGLWHPDNRTLTQVREAILEDARRWKRILSSPAFKKSCKLSGDSLKKPPRGYDPDHPLIDDLRRRDFVTVTSVSEQEVCSAEFLNRFTQTCRRAAPFVGFLTHAVGLDF